ncbi:MAG: DUF4416 family protein [Candidatus Marinimicrobia bacterium]|nr:DUF4416 family protein [Candidatus Neomarinimicrobiota bacterium]
MGEIRKSAPLVHPFAAVMFPNEELHHQSLDLLQKKFGEPLGLGRIFKVMDFTNYYVKEFGENLKKQFIVFREPRSVEKLYQSKIWSNEVELTIQEPKDKQRFVNIDPGYLAPSKFVLFSSKDFSHRIHVGEGIFAEITLLFMHGKFHKMGWTYNDYWDEENRKFLTDMRQKIVSISRGN